MRKEFIPKLTVAEITWLFEHGFTIRTDFIRREGYYHWLYYMGKFDSLGVYRSERACYNLARRIEAKRITLVPDAPESQALP